jgi:hypothetical protein
MTMAKQSNARSYPKQLALFAFLFLSIAAMALVSDTASAQLLAQRQQQEQSQVRRAATRIHPPERTKTKISTTPVALPQPSIDVTSALGQALAACTQGAAVQETFTLPGLKGEITLDRCYKGRAHLNCVLTALSTEARSLTETYTKIVDAKYPDLNSVGGVCQVTLQTLTTDIAGSEDFARRFRELNSQYEAATKCTGSVEQAFKGVSLADMAQGPEMLESITATIDDGIAEISEVHEQIADLASKMEQSNKAMKAVTKIHLALCMNEKAAAQSNANHIVQNR